MDVFCDTRYMCALCSSPLCYKTQQCKDFIWYSQSKYLFSTLVITFAATVMTTISSKPDIQKEGSKNKG